MMQLTVMVQVINGWIKYDAAFFGQNNSAIAYTVYGSPSTIIPFNTNSTTSTSNDTISQGTHRIGREQLTCRW